MSGTWQTGRKVKPILTFRHKEWARDALCAQVDSEIFFPDKGKGNHEAKAICAQCPVAQQCLTFALSTPMQLNGIWGGTSEEERQELRRGRTKEERYDPFITHGTEAGYKRHVRRGEKPCGQCRDGANRSKRQRTERRTGKPA